MSAIRPQIGKLGDRGILLRWDLHFAPEELRILLFYKNKIQGLLGPDVEVTNTYDSLLVRYRRISNAIDRDIERLNALDLQIDKNLETFPNGGTEESTVLQIPVCYDEKFGLDLQFLANIKKLPVEELIRLHTNPLYTVYFIGFLPGFPYLGGMDIKLSHPRKPQPRRCVEKGAVGIAGNQTGIYPNESPAGWQIIGNCPLELFDVHDKNPCLLKAGDMIRFSPVDLEEYHVIKQQVEHGRFEPKNITEDV